MTGTERLRVTRERAPARRSADPADRDGPCGVPSTLGLTSPFSITPALRNARMSFNSRLSSTTHQFVVIDSIEIDSSVAQPLKTMKTIACVIDFLSRISYSSALTQIG
jgi:hypothetical protein